MGRTEQSKTARENCSTLFQHRESGNGKAGLEGISVVFLFLHKCLKFIIGLVFFSLTIAKRAACFTVRSLFILRRRQEREMASCSVWSIRFGRDRSVSELNKTFETILVLHLVFVFVGAGGFCVGHQFLPLWAHSTTAQCRLHRPLGFGFHILFLKACSILE